MIRLRTNSVIVEAPQGRPYKGAESYGFQDAELFFGREQEAKQCSDLILACRVSLLYAASGAGKTSLLDARILPALEMHGWLPVRVRIGDDPIAATRDSVLLQAFPQPETECACVDQLCALLGSDSLTLSEAVDRFYALPPSNDGKRNLLMPRSTRITSLSANQGVLEGTITPFVARLVRGVATPEDFSRSLQLLAAYCNGELVDNYRCLVR